jgi:multimeric flavodoxin WrbA
MKVVAFNGSPNKEGNTFQAIQIVAKELENEGIQVEVIHVGNKTIKGCTACMICAQNMDEKCIIPKDDVNDWIQKMKTADGIILGSPVYYAGVNGTMKSFLDRAFFVAGVNNSMLRHKVGASIVAVRRSGGLPTLNGLNHFLNYSEMMMPTSNYWHVIHGMMPGEVHSDEEGTQIARILGKNMAYLMKAMNLAKESIPAPKKEDKTYTNFVR